jgi:hypothetical protein
MAKSVSVRWDKSGIAGLETGKLKGAVVRALRKAGVTALRDMRSEAKRRIGELKRLSSKYVNRALTLSQSKGSDVAQLQWALVVSGKPVPLIAYPHRAKKAPRLGKRRQGPRDRGGMVVEVNPGKKTLIRGAFVARMSSGHEGIFKRLGHKRLPIKELLGSRPIDALLHSGQAEGVAKRGGESFSSTFERVLPLEIGKSAK